MFGTVRRCTPEEVIVELLKSVYLTFLILMSRIQPTHHIFRMVRTSFITMPHYAGSGLRALPRERKSSIFVFF